MIILFVLLVSDEMLEMEMCFTFTHRSSRSHAIFTITVHRTMVEVMNEVGEDIKAKVRTSEFTSKLHLVDLAGELFKFDR